MLRCDIAYLPTIHNYLRTDAIIPEWSRGPAIAHIVFLLLSCQGSCIIEKMYDSCTSHLSYSSATTGDLCPKSSSDTGLTLVHTLEAVLLLLLAFPVANAKHRACTTMAHNLITATSVSSSVIESGVAQTRWPPTKYPDRRDR
jgi:steroid 5-alpha reductase family enzyme